MEIALKNLYCIVPTVTLDLSLSESSDTTVCAIKFCTLLTFSKIKIIAKKRIIPATVKPSILSVFFIPLEFI
jgi:hypothetical protein